MDSALYSAYVDILREELVPAMGCTEPIAVAYAGALARKTLGTYPSRIELGVSGNIIKNVKSVIVPHTGGRKGLPVAVAAGARIGDADAQLEVLASVTEEQLPLLSEYLDSTEIVVSKSPLHCPFDIQVRAYAGEDTAFVQIVGSHTNVVRIERNGEVLLSKPFSEEASQPPENRKLLTVENIIAFADEVNLDDVREPIARQIAYNTAIAEDILPGMQQHMYAARTLNTLLTESFGEKYAVLTPELYSSFEEAVAAYEKQISMGQSTADAAERMTRCMTGIETALNDRFGKDGLLSPRTALK